MTTASTGNISRANGTLHISQLALTRGLLRAVAASLNNVLLHPAVQIAVMPA